MISVNGKRVIPLIFSDKTSQVWKLNLNEIGQTAYIRWYYENEAELIHLNQLIALLVHSKITIAELEVPYLPYGRQDKPMSNESTWAKATFLNMLDTKNIHKLLTLDIHSTDLGTRWESVVPTGYIERAIWKTSNNNLKVTPVLVFPDLSASKRYPHFDLPVVVLEKVREPLTGEITGVKISEEGTTVNPGDYMFRSDIPRFLIVDDICDGGRTFTEAANVVLRDIHPKALINLYVTHGIFSKGTKPLLDSGIQKIFTTNSLEAFREANPKNYEGVIIL